MCTQIHDEAHVTISRLIDRQRTNPPGENGSSLHRRLLHDGLDSVRERPQPPSGAIEMAIEYGCFGYPWSIVDGPGTEPAYA